jgi:hypothetical protein
VSDSKVPPHAVGLFASSLNEENKKLRDEKRKMSFLSFIKQINFLVSIFFGTVTKHLAGRC